MEKSKERKGKRKKGIEERDGKGGRE